MLYRNGLNLIGETKHLLSIILIVIATPLVGIVKLPVRYKYISMYMIFFILFSLFCVFINTTGDSDVSRMTQYRNILYIPQQYYHTKTLIFINSQFYKIALILTYISAYVAIYNGVILDKPIFKGTGLIIIVGLFCIGSSDCYGCTSTSY